MILLMIRKLVLFLSPFLNAVCAQTFSTRDFDKTESILSISFQSYFFSVGAYNRAQAVFLKRPDDGVMVTSNSPEITSTTAAYAEAMPFMRVKRGTGVSLPNWCLIRIHP